MAVLAPAVTAAIIAAGSAIFPGSQSIPRIASAVGTSLTSWLPSPLNVTAQGVTTGVAGTGAVTGKMAVVPTGSIFTVTFSAAGLVGPSASGLAQAIEQGVASSFNASAQYVGTSAGVGVGADVSKITNANSGTLIPILLGNLASLQVAGLNSSKLAVGIGNGISALLRTGFGAGGVAGSPSPVGAAGTSVSTVF